MPGTASMPAALMGLNMLIDLTSPSLS